MNLRKLWYSRTMRTVGFMAGAYALLSAIPKHPLFTEENTIDWTFFISPLTLISFLFCWGVLYPWARIMMTKKPRISHPKDAFFVSKPRVSAAIAAVATSLALETIMYLATNHEDPNTFFSAENLKLRAVADAYSASLFFSGWYLAFAALSNFAPNHLLNFYRHITLNPKAKLSRIWFRNNQRYLQKMKEGDLEKALLFIDFPKKTLFDLFFSRYIWCPETRERKEEEYRQQPDNPRPLLSLQLSYMYSGMHKETIELARRIIANHPDPALLAFEAYVYSHIGADSTFLFDKLSSTFSEYAPKAYYPSTGKEVFTLDAGKYVQATVLAYKGKLKAEWERTRAVHDVLKEHSLLPLAFQPGDPDMMYAYHARAGPIRAGHFGEVVRVLKKMRSVSPEAFPFLDYEADFRKSLQRIGLSYKQTDAWSLLEQRQPIHNNLHENNVLWDDKDKHPVLLDWGDGAYGHPFIDLLTLARSLRLEPKRDSLCERVADVLVTARRLGKHYQYGEGSFEERYQDFREACRAVKKDVSALCYV